nr:probable polygalacturonase [Ipomoea batatas]
MTDGEAVVAGDAWCVVDDYGVVGEASVEPRLPACPPPRRCYCRGRDAVSSGGGRPPALLGVIAGVGERRRGGHRRRATVVLSSMTYAMVREGRGSDDGAAVVLPAGDLSQRWSHILTIPFSGSASTLHRPQRQIHRRRHDGSSLLPRLSAQAIAPSCGHALRPYYRKTYGWRSFDYSAISCRRFTACLTDFGGVGDGVTLNTDVFRTAVDFLSGFGQQGGSMLYVPPGKWLTGSFNLTSHFTLFLDQDAVILASQDENEYPVIEPLPSYGRVRDTQGGRFISLIFGTNLTDVIITGNNGTLDGQGSLWWDKFHNRTLNYTRPYLIEIMYSENIQISNLTLLNSPSWNVHPVYSSDIIIEGITIIAPTRSRNTDGINPDSCINTRIQDCYIVSGDDCIAVKSGWDEYGIAFGMPTKHLVIRRVTCISPTSAVIALGSEMSGGIEDVRAEDIVAINTESSVRIKTGVGRGGYVKDIYVRRVTMKTMKYVFWMTGNYGSHPDDKYDPNAFPVIKNINYRDMVAENVTMAGRLDGILGDPFTGICISNVTIEMGQHAMLPWNCTDISGVSSGVVPQPCGLLPDQGPDKVCSCDFPAETLPIENVEVQTCAFRQKLHMV